MIEITDKIEGPFSLQEDTVLRGMIDNQATVPNGLTFVLLGMVTGDLIAEEGSTVKIHGMVNGTVFNHGADIEVFGIVGNIIDLVSETPTKIDSAAVIKKIPD